MKIGREFAFLGLEPCVSCEAQIQSRVFKDLRWRPIASRTCHGKRR